MMKQNVTVGTFVVLTGKLQICFAEKDEIIFNQRHFAKNIKFFLTMSGKFFF
jgi:hypothetical protein